MIENFEKGFKILMDLEGYYACLKDDFGGETILGITSKFYPEIYLKLKEACTPDKAVPIAKEFYRKEFWFKYGCDDLPDKIDILYFVTAVNTPRGEKVMALAVGSFENECLDAILYYVQTNNKDDRRLSLVKRVLRVWQALNQGDVTI